MTKLPRSVASSSSSLSLSEREVPLSLEVACEGGAVRATIVDRRPEMLEAFTPLDASRAEAFASAAWTLGLQAVMSAHRGAETSHFKDIGGELVTQIEQRLEAYVMRQQQGIGETLRSYFDPREGQVALRLEAFVKDGGELSRSLATYLAPGHGALAKTLAQEVGEHSPLLRKLSPTDTEGVVVLIERAVQSTLQQNQASLAKALDPLAPEGAVARLLTALRGEAEKAGKDQAEKLAAVTRALDANDERSLLSRLHRETQAATRAVLLAVNPEAPGSALAVLKASLSTQLDAVIKRNAEALQASEARQQKTLHEIRETVVRLDERRKAESRGTRGGLAFEDSVATFVQAVSKGASVLVDAVGATVGVRPNCKVGDVVVRHAPQTAHAGATLVIEAKREKGYTVTHALEELEVARANRGAAAGLFVMAQSHAPAGFSGLRCYGEDVVVVWDPEDASTDAYLEVGVVLGLTLAARAARPKEQGQIDALADVEQRLLKEIARHEKMRGHVSEIRKRADALSAELDRADGKLQALVKNAKQTLRALDVEPTDHVEARQNPIGLMPGATGRGRRALGDDEEAA